MRKLNLGCGNDIRPDFINLDQYPHPGVDIVHNINDPLPFPDGDFDEVHANQVLEHLSEIIPIMNELYRIIKPGGSLFIAVPFWSGTWARGDPTHRRFFDHNSFNPFSCWYSQYAFYGVKGPWEKISQEYDRDPNFLKDKFLKGAGYSEIYNMRVVLKRGP